MSNGEIRIEMHYSVALLLLFDCANTPKMDSDKESKVYRVVRKVLRERRTAPFWKQAFFLNKGKIEGKVGGEEKCLHSDVEIASTICDECCVRKLVTRGWNRCYSSNRPAKGRNLEWEDYSWKKPSLENYHVVEIHVRS